ncbi:MAG: helicase-related protein [Geminicoccaceae bacterium]
MALRDQLTLSLFDDTSLLGLTADVPAAAARPILDPRMPDDPPGLLPVDYRLAGERRLAATWCLRAADNLAAIELLRRIEAEDRPATADEQQILARFVGFGASELANPLFPRAGERFAPAWRDLGRRLEERTTPPERAALARSTQYAHYTPDFLVRWIWTALQRLGFAGGRVLEPGCGIGLFLAQLSPALAPATRVTGIEAEPISARIARLLFPSAAIRNEDFTTLRLQPGFDLVLGNPPFSDRTVRGDAATVRPRLALHDFFIARSLELLRPGGLAAFVTTRWTLDKQDDSARAYLAGMANLLTAIRLPEGALRQEAGTDVVVDVLILRKRLAGEAPAGPAWQTLAEALPAEDGEAALAINRYFLDQPAQVLGRHARTTTPYGVGYSCAPDPRLVLEDALQAALARLPQGIALPPGDETSADPDVGIAVGTAAEDAEVKEGSFLLGRQGELLEITGGEPVPVAIRSGQGTEGIPAKHARIIRGLIPIRNAVRAILRAQAADQPWGSAQARLRLAYQAFAHSFGPINLTRTIQRIDPTSGETRESQRRVNLAPFQADPDCWLVASIELYDPTSGQAQPGPIFTQRVLHPPAAPVIVTAADALAVTLHDCGMVDVDRIAELLGRSHEDALAELGEAVFLDPESGCYETADSYLSGPVRNKLALARSRADTDPAFARNVTALERVQPQDLLPSQITARLGAPWIPAEILTPFVAERLGIATRVRHTVEIACWQVDLRPFEHQSSATTEWGTSRRHAGLLLEDALNQRLPQIWDVWLEDGQERRELNTEATEAAKEKLARLKTAFAQWVWTDTDRADLLARLYNASFNNLVVRHFDGSHLQLPGASGAIELHAHQKRVIWRIIATGATYIAHAVGAGKTFAIVAAIMEQKRLGLIGKALLVVPGHCLAQASREFLQLYPTASILVADDSNFAAAKRLRFMARAATGGWDCIIVTHSAFKLIPTPVEFERRLIREQLESYGELLERLDGEDRLARKRIERMKEGFEERLAALQSRKDNMVTIAELGIDQIIVDEAQEFRKLSFATNMTALKGIDPQGSQRAWDLLVKARFVATRQPTRPLILASGTPITNTMGELYTVQRFLQPETLRRNGLHEFDAWAASFGETRTELELQPSGRYKPVTRFCEFVNVPELIAMFRTVADVMVKHDLRPHLNLPRIAGGRRQILTATPTPAFRAYQKQLDQRIKVIEARKGRPQKGDDIQLSVITDGRHAAIDLRLVDPHSPDEPGNKLNLLIDNAYRIWCRTAQRRYRDPNGARHLLPGAGQLIFSDLGTLSVEARRGFSAYRWIKERLVRLGVPAGEIAFMQDHATNEAKRSLFADFNAGRVRFLIGSSPTMGTGVNVQARLVALHHLDVPWLPADIEQREGRIERQGNQHEEIQIFAYATLGSMDAPMWQTNERKARFIEHALTGDGSIRRLEDAGNQAGQFALAKAVASGDDRLMQQAGLASEITRLERLQAAHLDEQIAVRREIAASRREISAATSRAEAIAADLAQRTPTRGDAFTMTVEERRYGDRKPAGAALLQALMPLLRPGKPVRRTIGEVGGFALTAVREERGLIRSRPVCLLLQRSRFEQDIELDEAITPLGLIARLEHALNGLEAELAQQHRRRSENEARLHDYEARLDRPFELTAELEHKRQALAELLAELAADQRDAA